jgi:hypothetical protein
MALASYLSKIVPVNPRNYALLAQGPRDQIRQLQQEIDEYLGLQELAGAEVGNLRETPPIRDNRIWQPGACLPNPQHINRFS